MHRPNWPCAKPFQFKTFVHQDFYSTHLGTFVDLSNPHISKITNFIFHKTPYQATYAVVHRQPWPCAKPAELKTFVHQDFHGIHLRTFVGLSNPHISKITNFIFSQNSLASHLCRGAPPTLAMCKTVRTQNFRAPRFSWYSFGDFCKPFQPSHLKNHEFHFFTKLPTKPPMSWCTANLGHVQNPPKSKLSCTKNLMDSFGDICRPFQPSHLKNPEFHFFIKTPHQPI